MNKEKLIHIKKELEKLFKVLFGTFLILGSISYAESKLEGTLYISPEDIADYNLVTGTGCKVNKNINTLDEFHIVCKSRNSAESAWNNVLVKSKELCVSNKFRMLFKRPPSLPIENGIYGAQMDIKCI